VADLVAAGELAVFLRRPVRADTELVAIAMADGWLRGACSGLSDWPDPGSPDWAVLRAWALELTTIAYSNPESLTTSTAGDETQVWDARLRRREILDAATRKYGGVAPAYEFPPAPCWP